MGNIALLDKKTIDQIAAGEVVERPSSVVKELAENAIDAGAFAISIEIRDGGTSLIRITDDGCGMAADELPLAFTAHATSKLHEISDLDTIASLGFRGEALASIASVSRVELVTKRPEDLTATRFVIEGGQKKNEEEIGAPNGTTIIVRDLFYNVPARAKFLKTAITEAASVGSYVEQLALSHPGISFKYTVNGSVRLSTSGNGSLKDVIYRLYGKDVLRELIAVEVGSHENGIELSGFIAKPAFCRGNRQLENYYVNGRYVKNKILTKAIEDGFGNKLMQHQYPFTCLFLDIQGNRVDVNVHPTKMEVRFSDEPEIYLFLKNTIASCLSGQDMIITASPEAAADTGKKEKIKAPESFEINEREASKISRQDGKSPEKAAEASENSAKQPAEKAALPIPAEKTGEKKGIWTHIPTAAEVNGWNHNKKETADSPEKTGIIREKIPSYESRSEKETGHYEQQSLAFLTPEARKKHRLIGQIFDTYWLVEFDGSLYIIDQHAAHEKVLYERLISAYRSRELTSQLLLPPQIVSLTLAEEAVLQTHREAFEKLGFVIEPFGGRDYAIREVPYTLEALGGKSFFEEILQELSHNVSSGELETFDRYTYRVATEACKAAVKGHDHLSFDEANRLIDELLELEDPYHCPHGRPTIISFTRNDLEKRFKRIL